MADIITTSALKFEGFTEAERQIKQLIALKKDFEKPSTSRLRVSGGRGGLSPSGTPDVPDTRKLSLFGRVLKDLSGNTLQRFSARAGVSVSALEGISSAAGVSAGALTSVAAVVGPLVLVLSGLAAAVTATAAAYTFAASKAIEYQVATQSVAKTTDLVGNAFESTRQKLIDMSTDPQLGRTAAELAGITEVAGTLGIRGVDNLTIFTEAIARLNATSDVTGKEGTQQFGKFLAITQRAPAEALSLSSAITVLAAKYATTESAILRTSQEVAKGGISFNLAAEDALALAATYDEYGIQSELARSATLRLGQTIQSAVIAGGKDLEKLASIAGVSAGEMSDTFRRDAGDALLLLLKGFDRLGKQGQDVSAVLDDLGLSGVRLGAVIPTLASHTDRLADAMALAANESNNPSRIFAESANMADTTQRRFETLRNEVVALAIRVGDDLLPALDSMILTSSQILSVIESMKGVFGALGDTILTALAQKFAIVANEIQLVADVFQHGLFDALAGAGDLDRTAQQFSSFANELAKIDEAAKSGNLEKMMEVNAGLQSTIGEAAASAKRYKFRLDELLKATNNGADATKVQKAQIDGLRRAYQSANADATKYERASLGLREEIARLTNAKKDEEYQASITAAQAEKERQAREEARKEAEKYNKELEKLGKSITDSLRTPAEKAADEIAKLDELLAAGLITLDTWQRGVDRAKEPLNKLTKEVEAYNKAIADIAQVHQVTEVIQTFGVDTATATEAVKLSTDANIALADALDIVNRKRLELEAQEFAASGGFLGIPSDQEIERMSKGMDLWDIGTTRIQAYRKEVDKLNEQLDNEEITQQQYDNAMASLDGQMEGWEKLGARIAEIAENTGGVWGRVLKGISENLDKVGGALGDLSSIASQRGDMGNAQWIGAAQQAVQGNWGGAIAGAVQATGLGQQSVSQFGGLTSGNFMAEGAALGAKYGGAMGAVLGAAIGAFAKKGADDLHSHTVEMQGKADLIVTQAEGGLADIAGEIETAVEGYLNGLQDALFADLDLTGVEVHIREDRVRVISNGVEKVFHSLDEAFDFIVRGVMQANAGVEGLGEATRALFENASQFAKGAGDPERLMQAFGLAQRIDFEDTGVSQQVLKARQDEMSLAVDFGLPLAKLVELRQKEVRAAKDALQFSAASIVGISDVASSLRGLAEQSRVFNNTQLKAAEVDQKRIEELKALIAAQQEYSGSLFDSAEGADQRRGQLVQGLKEGRDSLEGYTHSQELANREIWQGARDLDSLTKELEALESAAGADLVDLDFIAEMINAGAAQAGVQMGEMILGFAEQGLLDLSEGEKLELRKQLFELEKIIAIAQMHAARMQLESLIALGQVGADVIEFFNGFVNSIPDLIGMITGAQFDPGKMASGGNRNRQAKEERRQEEEKRVQTLKDFAAVLDTLRLNASTATGTLGDLANRIADITSSAQEALEAGASVSDVRESQRLQLRDVRRQITDPFTSFGRDSFRDQAVDIEQRRRAAIEEARLVAQAMADSLGVPFEVVFDAMQQDINDGAARMKRALGLAVIDAFDLPIEQQRRANQELHKQLKDLEQARNDGTITQRRYLQLIDQISAAQEAAISSDVLGLMDTYYGEIEGKEELRRQMEIANFDLQLALARMRYDQLVTEGLLSQAAMDRVGGFLDFMENNPPDWEKFFAPPETTLGGSSGSMRGMSSAISSVSNGLDSLLTSINNFIDGFETADMGRFELMAHDYISSVEGFHESLENELDNMLDTGYRLGGHAQKAATDYLRQVTGDYSLVIGDLNQLTRDQLELLAGADLSNIAGFQEGVEEVFDVLLAIQNAEALKPEAIKNVLKEYKKVPEATSQLQSEFDTIMTDFEDVMTALQMLGATEADISQARMEHASQLLEFEKTALEDIRSVGKDIAGGQVFGNATARQRVQLAEQNLAELRARAVTGDLQAVEHLGAAMREVIESRKELTGGAGPEFTLALERIRLLSENFKLNIADVQTAEELAQSTAESQLAAIEDNTQQVTSSIAWNADQTTAAIQGFGADVRLATEGSYEALRMEMEMQRTVMQQQITLSTAANQFLESIDTRLLDMVLLQRGSGAGFTYTDRRG